MEAVFLVITISHASVTVLDSHGWAWNVQYVPMVTWEECQKVQPLIEQNLRNKWKWWKAYGRLEFDTTITVDCERMYP